MRILELRRDWVVRATVIWIGTGVALGLLDRPLMALLSFFLMLPIWACYALFGAGLLVVSLVRLPRRQSRRAAAIAAGLTLLFAAALWFGGWRHLSRAGDAVEFRLRFARLEPRYTTHVPVLLRDTTTSVGFQERGDITYVADPGPPRRLAFPQPGGLIDNWEGIVYDPTGAVAQARGWRFDGGGQGFTAPSGVRELFGGDIVECDHVRGAWYRCWFT